MLKNALHITASAALWIVFVCYWRIVLRQPMNPDTRTALVVLAILTVLTIVYLTGWIHHNLRIYRTSDRRRKRRSVVGSPDRDYLGRPLVFESHDTLERSNYIEVHIKEGFVAGRWVERKIFKTRAENGVEF